MKYNLSTFKAIIFDFDGVILDSETYKIKTFNSLFLNYPDYLEQIDFYNRTHQGINRYKKFQYIYENILHIPYTQEIETELGNKFKKSLVTNLKNLPLIPGAKSFLEQQHCPLFIASSASLDEIDEVLIKNKIKNYFVKVYAHPTEKTEAIRNVIQTVGIRPNQALFFGDAPADFEAAKKTNVTFIARTETPEEFPTDVKYILNFTALTY